jgi:hypothetical protein
MLNMRYFAVLLIFFLEVGGALAQSQQPPHQSEQPAAPNQRGTDQVPFTIKILPAPGAQEKASKEERDRIEKTKIDEKLAFETQRIADYTDWLARFTFLLFCIAILQAGLFVWQLSYMRRGVKDAGIAAIAARDAAKAARDSADISKLSMVASDRAYVHHHGVRWMSYLDQGSQKLFWRLRPVWINNGNTPTRKLTLYTEHIGFIGPMGNDFTFPVDSQKILTPAVLAPKGTIQGEHADIPATDLAEVASGKKTFYV